MADLELAIVMGMIHVHLKIRIDNLYALSQLFQLPLDAIVRGNRKAIIPEPIIMDARERRLWTYYRKIRELAVA